MDRIELKQKWLAEEAIAHIHGWDFSHIDDLYEQPDNYPWNYRDLILRHLNPEMKILDMDTGGGEFLLSLNHPHANTAATEAFPPNVQLCRETLLPLGVDFREAKADGTLPFADETFDMVINRHGSYCAAEIARVLKPGGLFITQQVGAENDRELVYLLLPELRGIPHGGNTLASATQEFTDAGLERIDGGEYFGPIRFFDVGALVWFARIIEWEFVGFSVERCLDQLLEAQRILDKTGCIKGSIHRFMLIAKKK